MNYYTIRMIIFIIILLICCVKFKNGYFINNKNIKKSKDDYTKLIQFYSIEKIINMTEIELKDALDEIDNLKPITN